MTVTMKDENFSFSLIEMDEGKLKIFAKEFDLS